MSEAASVGADDAIRRVAAKADERELVEGLRAKDPRAFERLVRTHIARLRAVALRLLQQPEDADEIVQEAFLSAFRSFDSFRGDARLATWLHRIVVNAALARLRQRKGHAGPGELVDVSELLPRFQPNGWPEQMHQHWVRPIDEIAAAAETREQVRQLIDRLPENYRTVLILRDIEELNTAESAELLGLSEGTLKVRLHRARQALRNLFERELELTSEA